MTDDVKHAEDDLFTGTDGDDVSTDGESTEELSDDSSDQLEHLSKDAAKSKFVDDWAKNIAAGKKTLDELKIKQPWLLTDVEKKLEGEKKPALEKEELAKIAREEARKMLEEDRNATKLAESANRFTDLKATIVSLQLPKSKMEELKSHIKTIREKYGENIDAYDVLSLAAEKAKIDFEDDLAERKSRVPSIRAGGSSVEKSTEVETAQSVNRMSPDERLKLIKSRQGMR